MPVYEYLCADCGPFTATRPMAEFDRAQPCPGCAGEAPRVLAAPQTMSSGRGAAGESRAPAAAPAHASGCSCCSGFSSRFGSRGKDGGARGRNFTASS